LPALWTNLGATTTAPAPSVDPGEGFEVDEVVAAAIAMGQSPGLSPRMPLDSKRTITRHRDHEMPCPYLARVARTVDKKERNSTPAALQSVKKEWDKLRAWKDPPCLDEDNPRELEEVRREALRSEQKYHFGRIFDICVEKGSELPEGDPARKFKGRAVFQGNRVWD